MLQRTTLRQLLTIPYVLLVLLTALVIGVLSFQAGRNAVDSLSDLILHETVNRITQAIDRHVSGSEAVLETAFPTDIAAPLSIGDELESLRERLWLATTIHRDPNNYAYYGDRLGQFIGLWRFSDTEAELRLRTDSATNRSTYRFSRINGPLQDPVIEKRVFDPRERPWFIAGQSADSQTWTSIYIDFKTLELVSTRARRVDDEEGQFQGVVATDLSLEHLNRFLKTLALSENGVAFIVEPDGKLVATSRGPHLGEATNGDNTRLNAVDSDDRLIASTYSYVSELTVQPDARPGTQTTSFNSPDGDIIQAGYLRLQDTAGLEWMVAVAVPREDFMYEVTRNVRSTVVLAIAGCALIVLIGMLILNRITRDLRQLASAARAMGEGDLSASVPVDRADEVGELAKAFSDLQGRLLTDRLTGMANREAIVRRLEDRIIRHRRRQDNHPFALLFIDLNGFKQINDELGHDVGDQVLIEVSERLSQGLRENDMAARFGGDEFVVMIDRAESRATVLGICKHLKTTLIQPYNCILALNKTAGGYTQGASIGYALFPDDGKDLETLIKRADVQMYAAKTGLRKRRSKLDYS
ncbi:MAG: diguanylate cyclase [Granulosicoccus sp.]